MSMQRLMSAAHAAGYAMAAEDFDPEPRAECTSRRVNSRAVALRAPTPIMIEMLRLRRTLRSLRRVWLSDWVAAHWTGRATA